jgi:hypothetical protein
MAFGAEHARGRVDAKRQLSEGQGEQFAANSLNKLSIEISPWNFKPSKNG